MYERKDHLKSLALGLALLLALLSLAGCGSSSPKTAAPASPTPRIAPEVGALAPDFTLYSLKGERVTLSQLRGEKVLLNFWATWCPPCRREMPYLQEAFREEGHHVRFIGVNLGEPAARVKQFVQANGLDFTILIGAKAQDVAEAYRVRYIPSTFLIDEQGVIRQTKIGAFASLNELLSSLENL